MSDPDSVKQVISEWVLTNGKLPGFEERAKASLPRWKVVGPGGMFVFRGQGGFIKGPAGSPPPSILASGVRPILATSLNPSSIVRYADKDCCMFKIKLLPGTRYLNVSGTISFTTADHTPALAVKNDVLEVIRSECPGPEMGRFPSDNTPLWRMRKAILERCVGRYKIVEPGKVEYIPPEEEVMVYAVGGSFSVPVKIEEGIEGKLAYTVNYNPAPPEGGRNRTVKRKRSRRIRTQRGVVVR
jgi:hypothetical protein